MEGGEVKAVRYKNHFKPVRSKKGRGSAPPTTMIPTTGVVVVLGRVGDVVGIQ